MICHRFMATTAIIGCLPYFTSRVFFIFSILFDFLPYENMTFSHSVWYLHDHIFNECIYRTKKLYNKPAFIYSSKMSKRKGTGIFGPNHFKCLKYDQKNSLWVLCDEEKINIIGTHSILKVLFGIFENELWIGYKQIIFVIAAVLTFCWKNTSRNWQIHHSIMLKLSIK